MPHLSDHSYAMRKDLQMEPPPKHLEEHDYQMSEENLNNLYHKALEISVQYADDCGYAIISENNKLVNYRASTTPNTLKERNLNCNEDKNEDYLIKSKGTDEWKTCKYLGSLLNTEADIKRRKSLALTAMNNMDDIWKSRLSRNIKIRIFNACIAPIFLCNSELWTTTSSTNGIINAFQRRLLRYAINIKYPKTISTQKLKETLKYTDWSTYISTQRLRWLGHALRLPEDSPAKQALYVIEEPTLRTVGRPKLKWIDVVKQQLQQLDISWEDAQNMHRVEWRGVVDRWRKLQDATPVASN